MSAEAAADLIQQRLIIASRLRAVGLIISTLSSPGPPPCCYTGPSVCHFLLLHCPLQSSVFVCVHMLWASRDGGLGVREISLFHWEQYPFWCISGLFVSLTRTNRLVADRRRMKWREGKKVNEVEMREWETLFAGHSRPLDYLSVVYGCCCF